MEDSVILGSIENAGSLLPGCLGTPTRDTTIIGPVNRCNNLRHLGRDYTSPSNTLASRSHMCSYSRAAGWDERFCLPLALPGQLWARATCHHGPPRTSWVPLQTPPRRAGQPTGRRRLREVLQCLYKGYLALGRSFILISECVAQLLAAFFQRLTSHTCVFRTLGAV